MLTKSDISYFPDILGYFKKYYPSCIDKILDISIVKVPQSLWGKSNFAGYGYVVRKSDLIPNQRYLEMYSSSQKLYESLPTKEHKRDINIYKILKLLNFPEIFILVLDDPNSKFFIIHELSHICGIDQSFNYDMRFGDEYLDSKEEQNSYFSEIRYAKQNNMSFEEYFKLAHPTEYKILSEGKNNRNKELYELAELDQRDYKRMWDNIKG
jgi:hypothetical protein